METNKNCDYCNYCYRCDHCNYCYCSYSCNYCYFCNSCNSCNSCYCCDQCKSCDSCDYCSYCYYCKNLKMTEYNYFCWSTYHNSDNSFQQKRYRVFNVEVGAEEYSKIKKIHHKLEFDKNECSSTRFQTAFKKMWSNLTQEEKQEYFNIPHFNWEGFTFITGVEKEDDAIEMTVADISAKLGHKIKIIE